jgi:hypothetical protein
MSRFDDQPVRPAAIRRACAAARYNVSGRWLGPDRHFEIDSGRWHLQRAG